MVTNAGIACRTRVACPVCSRVGTTAYAGLKDHLFGAPGEWGLRECAACDLLWLDPIPETNDIGKLYERYYTHGANAAGGKTALKRHLLAQAFGYPSPSRDPALESVAALLAVLPAFRDFAGGAVMWLPYTPGAKLLDIGCGSGEFPARMRSLGWDAAGVETDPAAAEFARAQYKLDVRSGDLFAQKYPAQSFDVVTLSHVIEHVPAPAEYFAEIRRILRPEGTVALVTPNRHSLAHCEFGSAWRGLEVPRHFHIFSRKSLRGLAEAAGLEVRELRTVTRTARNIWWESKKLAGAGGRVNVGSDGIGPRGMDKARGFLFQAREELGNYTRAWGEEILLIAERAP